MGGERWDVIIVVGGGVGVSGDGGVSGVGR